nr:Gfo/Idh/MocA family oxidoreductase [Verrucomicrobiota bacterium]
ADVRRMIAEAGSDFDALVISHYDHLHGIAITAALNAGKPVCSERPLGLRIAEARRLRALAAKTGLPVTYRSPGTASGQFRRAMELVEDGAIGEVREVHVWFKRGGPDRDKLPAGAQPPPPELDWDAWLGPLAARDFHPDWMAYGNWRETSSGGLCVFGMHTTIFPFMALGLRQLWNRPAGAEPLRVTAECARLNRISFPKWERIRWEVPARGNLPPVTLTWHHGPGYAPGTREVILEKLRPFGVEKVEEVDAFMKTAGSLLVGSKGAFVGDDHSVNITHFPAAAFAGVETKQPLRMPRSRGLYRDWIDACRGEKPHIVATFDNGGPLSELLMLGNIATLFPGEPLHYDAALGRITNKDEANAYLDYAARER